MTARHPLSIFGTILLLAGLGIGLFYLFVEHPREAALAGPEGRSVIGRVANLGTEQTGRYSGYFADISFSDENGRAHSFRSFFTLADWGDFRQGQSVTVRYLNRDPDYAVEPHSYKAKRDPKVMLLIDGGLILFGVALLALARVR